MADQLPEAIQKTLVLNSVKSVDVAKRYAKFIITTKSPDQVNDIIEPKGVDITEYAKNPIVFLEHGRSSAIPVGLSKDADGKLDLQIFDDRIEAGVYFGEHAEGSAALYCVQNDLVKGASIGAKPLERVYLDNGGVHYLKSSMREWSITARPMNLECWKKDAGMPDIIKSWVEKSKKDRDDDDDDNDADLPGLRFAKSFHKSMMGCCKTGDEGNDTHENPTLKSAYEDEIRPMLHEAHGILRKAVKSEYGHELEAPEGASKKTKSSTVGLIRKSAEAIKKLLRTGKPQYASERHEMERLIDELLNSVKQAAEQDSPEVDPKIAELAARFQKLAKV